MCPGAAAVQAGIKTLHFVTVVASLFGEWKLKVKESECSVRGG